MMRFIFQSVASENLLYLSVQMPACCEFQTTELIFFRPNCDKRIIKVSKAGINMRRVGSKNVVRPFCDKEYYPYHQ